MWSRDDLAARIAPGCIGMIHLAPLPGAPNHAGSLATVTELALSDLSALVDGGIGAVMVENFHDVPFHPGRVPAVTVAAMAVIIASIRATAPDLAIGVNVLRNDPDGALAIAAAAGADFIRVNVHAGSMLTDQGTISGQAHRTLRRRRELALEHVGILADLRVKHAAPLATRALVDEARDLRHRALADALIVSGTATGSAADADVLGALRTAMSEVPLLVGSGVTVANLASYQAFADGVIVGTSLQVDGRIDTGRVRTLVAALASRKDSA